MTLMNTDKELICGGAGGGRQGRVGGSRKMPWHPKVDVPIEGVLECRDFPTEELEGRVKGVQRFWRRSEDSEAEISHYRTDAQKVNDRESEQPEQPGAAAMWFGRFRGGSLGLVCGGLGHGFELRAVPTPERQVRNEALVEGGAVVGPRNEWVIERENPVIGDRAFIEEVDGWAKAQKIKQRKRYERNGEPTRAAVFRIRAVSLESLGISELFTHCGSVARKACGEEKFNRQINTNGGRTLPGREADERADR